MQHSSRQFQSMCKRVLPQKNPNKNKDFTKHRDASAIFLTLPSHMSSGSIYAIFIYFLQINRFRPTFNNRVNPCF